MLASFLTVNVTAADDLSIIAVRFRAHPQTYSIFDEKVPTNLLWVEFNNPIDHAATYDDASKTYELDGKYYQIEIERPAHGPSDRQHEKVSIVPGNAVSGLVKDDVLVQNNQKHRYHGWQIGSHGDLFEKDETAEYQVGEYIAKLNLINTDSRPGSLEEANAHKENIDSKSLTIVEITYQLSEKDKAKNYKLKCPNEVQASEKITELAMVGDWITLVDPSLDTESVADDGGKNMTILGWKVVKQDGSTLDTTVGDAIPEDNQDGKEDNKITLEAVLGEPKSYTYEFRENKEDGTKVDNPDEAASYNKILGGDTEKKLEYKAEETLEPLELRLVNTGNQRICVSTYAEDDMFTVEKINQNTGTEAQKLYSDGGLEVNNSRFWYIPSQKDVDAQQSEKWVNYAIVKITPRKGLAAGTHTGTITSLNSSGGGRVSQSFKIQIKVDRKTVQIAPENITKPYGKALTQSDIICDVYDTDGVKPLEQDKTAAELGVTISSDGIGKDAAVNGGTPYPFKIDVREGVKNYDVELKADSGTGITVQKSVPKRMTMSVININSGNTLTDSMLDGHYVNEYSGDEVAGTFSLVNGEEKVTGSGMIQKDIQFTPKDDQNYNKPEKSYVFVNITQKQSSGLSVVSSTLNRTYNGSPQKPTYRWTRGDDLSSKLTVLYKKVENKEDEEFKEDEQFDESGGYSSTPPTKAGTYKVHAVTAENKYYAEGIVNSIMTINPFQLELSLSGSVNDKVYDGTNAATVDASKVKFVKKPGVSDEVSVKESAFTATFNSKNADPHYIQQVTVVVNGRDALEGADAENYTLADSQTYHTTASISQRPIRLALKNTIKKPYGKAYEFTSNDYTAALSQPEGGGLAANDTVDMLRAVVKAENNGVDGASAEAKVGTYTVTASTPGISGYNYSITGDSLGSLVVEKATPQVLGEVSATVGLVGNPLSSVNLDGTFINPNNSGMQVQGNLEWSDSSTLLQEGQQPYGWKFTPNDNENYNSTTGEVLVTAGNKEPAPLELIVPQDVVYDGEPHPATVKTDNEAKTTIEYKKNDDIELHDEAEVLSDTWTQEVPKDAGSYEVRATVYAFGDYAQNVEIKSMTILPAEPKGAVTASSVDRGSYLSASQLTHDYKDINGETLEGTLTWKLQGVSEPTTIIVDPDTEYDWIFVPFDRNYKDMEGKTKVAINVDTRTAEAVIYNLPTGYDNIGDYARVNVDGLKVGDVVQFFGDADMQNPESDRLEIIDGMSGMVKVNVDDDALNSGKGTLYVNILGSTEVTPIEYKAEVGFRLLPTQIYLKEGENESVSINKSDESYTVKSVNWSSEQEGTASVEGDLNGATVHGVNDGSTRITAAAEFNHPDPSEADKSIPFTNYATVTVTEEQAPDYKYTTNQAENVTSTGATLKGHIEITRYGTTITPNAVGMFLLWEESNPSAKVRYGNDSPIVLQESGDYEIAVDGLTPNTNYVYQAVGIEGQTVTQGEPVTFTTGEEQAPDYKYTTNHAENITATGATLKGHIQITRYGTTITPNAVGMFLLWEEGNPSEKVRYGSEDRNILHESGDYEIAVNDLKPNTKYMYQAVGMEGQSFTPGETVTFTTGEEQAPDYKYTTNEAENITATGATLKGHIEITRYGTTITPNAVGMFLLWEESNPSEKVRYGSEDRNILHESGDYEIAVNDLKPNTKYMYQAVGMEGQSFTPGETVTFTTGEGEVILPYVVTNFNVDNSGVANATFTNNSSESVDVSLISASYNALERLASAQLTTLSVGVGETVTLTTEALTDIAAKIKAYLWNANTYQPYADAVAPEQ